MQIVLRLLLTFAICISSCTQVRNIKDAQEPESFYSKVNKAVKGKAVTIITTSGESYEGTDVVVASDSTQWVLESSGEQVVYPTDQIHMVRIKDHSKGMIGGCISGLVLGLAAAAVVTFIMPESVDGLSAIIMGPLIGISVGAGIGAVRGHRDEYIINTYIEN